MKCVSITEAVIFCAVLFVGLAGADNAATVNDSSAKSELNVTLLDFGPVGDHGWTYEAHMGASKMARKLSYVNLSEKENAAGPNAPQLLREYAENGAKLIFCHSSEFRNAIQEVAPEYPNVVFMWGGGTEKLAPNAGVYYERIYEAQYLAGIVAGNMTKTDKIAFVAALPTSQVIIGINAFAKGVASSNPNATVYVEWIGGWYDPEKERAVALSLINKGCDIITHWSDSDATGQIADEMGTYFISFGSDVGRFSPRVYLTGAIWNWEPIMTDIVESVHNGTWSAHPSQEWWYGLAEGGVRLAPFSKLVPGNIRSFVDKMQEEIVQKELAIFPGMSDEELKTMYYLEPNVAGELPKA
ncbi:MAG: BMP family ABC transporter substrate-binding protein [Methanothrix sp.]|nr:MAG: BMP family ABC transporter substrate-binding protein [Methanothrix sp.]